MKTFLFIVTVAVLIVIAVLLRNSFYSPINIEQITTESVDLNQESKSLDSSEKDLNSLDSELDKLNTEANSL